MYLNKDFLAGRRAPYATSTLATDQEREETLTSLECEEHCTVEMTHSQRDKAEKINKRFHLDAIQHRSINEEPPRLLGRRSIRGCKITLSQSSIEVTLRESKKSKHPAILYRLIARSWNTTTCVVNS
ncbi:hypothetical protein RRG08_004192 [Elysia crispata]|uniref:Uncharacterized protein n=1 Tax=Elysia crispata TaxID=231223 RepID=A0AAE1D5T5_9GAST|nr:hypothetical protein RRG08_004192 [Elysia crispata]